MTEEQRRDRINELGGYQKLFDAISAAVEPWPSKEQCSGISVSVFKFVEALSAPSSPGDGWETGWLIENYGSKHNIYRAEWLTADIYTHADDREHWTKDASKALRFARKADADAVIAALGWTEARATEHQWSAAPSPGGDHGA